MPTYEYVCKSCGHLFEIVRSMKDDPLTECPQCGGELRKVFAPPAISFKGSGFYATDQRKKAKERSSEAPEKKEPAAAGSRSSSDSDSGSGGSDSGSHSDSGSGSGGSDSGSGGSGHSSRRSDTEKTSEKTPEPKSSSRDDGSSNKEARRS